MIKDLIYEHGQCIRVYAGKESQIDPYEKNVETSLLNPILIKGIVSDIGFAQIQWKMPGVTADKAKEIIVEKKYRSLLELSTKISVKENNVWVDFQGWRINGAMTIREEGEVLRVYIYTIK